jgi:hypothetical protein
VFETNPPSCPLLLPPLHLLPILHPPLLSLNFLLFSILFRPPLRELVEGESNFPEMDANINVPKAVLEDYPGSRGAESFASFLKQPNGQGGGLRAGASSVNGWLSDDKAY